MNNAELVRDCTILKKELEEFAELTKVAFRDFKKCSLRILTEEIQVAWMKISDWSTGDRKSPFFAFDDESEATLKNAFSKVSEAKINRDEFAKIMEPFIQQVSDYKCEFSRALLEKEKDLAEAYTTHFCHSEYASFFSIPQIKDIIMSFLQE